MTVNQLPEGVFKCSEEDSLKMTTGVFATLIGYLP